jgi:hypothetical protein
MLRRTPLKRNPLQIALWRRRTAKPLPKVGKVGKIWAQIRPELKRAFQKANITKCELKLDGCWHTAALGFAHTLKRRNIPHGSPLLGEVVLACVVCHEIVEAMGEEKMCAKLREVIAARETPVVLDTPW